MISIPRDTMAEIEVFDQAGDSLGKTQDTVSTWRMRMVMGKMSAVI